MPDQSGWPEAAVTPPDVQLREEQKSAPWAGEVQEYLRLLSDARTLLLMKHHFFGRLAMRMRFEITEEVETAAVRADARCFFNPHFLMRIDISERAFVIAHELCHLMFGHLDRVQSKIWPLWNVAADLQINAALLKAGLSPPKDPALRPLYDSKYDEWSDEQIYWEIEGQTISSLLERLGMEWVEGADSWKIPGGLSGDCDFAATEILRRLAREGFGDRVMTAREWWDAVLDAWQASKTRGQAPASLERWVEGIRNPTLPWNRILARLASKVLAPGNSWRRPSRSSPAVRARVMARNGVPTALPGPKKDPEAVVIALDTSGSMSQDDLERSLGETAGVLALYQRPIRVLCCDAGIHMDEDFRNVVEIQPTGGGGSETGPVFERLEEEPGMWGRPALLIYFTDLFVGFPEQEPPYPVIWVNTSPRGEVKVPFGTVIGLGYE